MSNKNDTKVNSNDNMTDPSQLYFIPRLLNAIPAELEDLLKELDEKEEE